MSAKTATSRRLLMEPINPRTGAIWRLTDREVAPKIDSFQASLTDREKALEYLKQNGFLTPAGRTPKKYGG